MASVGVLGGFALAKRMCERGGMLKKDAFGPVERQWLSSFKDHEFTQNTSGGSALDDVNLLPADSR